MHRSCSTTRVFLFALTAAVPACVLLGYDQPGERRDDKHDDGDRGEEDLDGGDAASSLDASARDASIDAGLDRDANKKPALPDGSAVADAAGLDSGKLPTVIQCAPGRSCSPVCPSGACEVDCHDTASCNATCSGSCDLDCSGSDKCAYDCRYGSLACVADCSDTDDCQVRCRSGSKCDVDCTNGHCGVRCEPGSKCDVHCDSGASCAKVSCTFATCSARCPDPDDCSLSCTGALVQCGNGLVVCNGVCP